MYGGFADTWRGFVRSLQAGTQLAPAYVFFASQESSFVNGETLGVTGGQPLP